MPIDLASSDCVATPPQDNEVVGRKRNPKNLQPPAKKGRRKDPVWDDVIVADDIVSCKTCEKIIYQLGKTHVEHVRDHFKRKCPKRPVLKTITACFPPALVPVCNGVTRAGGYTGCVCPTMGTQYPES
ncbi:hypothetical protein PI124_g18014 [Phytophthora idaei]|nr:hypothetical protein PI124_g18014 [Phytophthora idaei]